MLDGAWGVLLQSRGLPRRTSAASASRDTRATSLNDPDLLNLTRPDLVRAVHDAYFAAGARHHDDEHLHGDVDRPGRLRARGRGLRHERRGRAHRARGRRRARRFVAGSVGPLNITLSLCPRVDDPGYRTHTFDQVVEAYAEQIRGARRRRRRPAADRDDLRHAEREGRDRRGARGRAGAAALDQRHDRRPLGPHAHRADDRGVLDVDRARRPVDRRRQLLARRDARCGRTSPTSRASRRAYVAAIRTPACRTRSAATTRRPTSPRRCLARVRARRLRSTSSARCCGSTPEHTQAIAEAVRGLAPRASRSGAARPRFSGLEPFEIGPDTGFVMIGERTNVTGSARFRRLVEAGDFPAAVDVALEQVRGGANLLDMNMDADLLEGEEAMPTFLNVIATEPEVARLPIMIDSSKWTVLEAGLQCLQGKGIVNSISPQGGRGGLPRAGARGPRLRRRRRRDGLRRAGPGDDVERTRRDLRPRVRPARRARSGSRRRTSSSTRTCSRSRPGSRSTTTTPAPSSRACRSSRSAARARAPRAASRTSASRSAATTASARRCTRRSSTTRSAPGSTWASSTRASSPSTRTSSPSCWSASRTSSSTGGPTRRSASSSSPSRVAGEGTRRELDLAWRDAPVGKRLEHALVHGIVDFVEDDAEEARAAGRRGRST